MTTAAVPTEQTQTDQQCPECGIYRGGHRLSCAHLDRSNPEAMRLAREVEAYIAVRMKRP